MLVEHVTLCIVTLCILKCSNQDEKYMYNKMILNGL